MTELSGTFELTDHLATPEEVKQTCDRSQRIEVLTAAYQMLESDSEKIFMLDAAAGFTVTLPSVANAGSGWQCKVVIKTAVTSNGYIITELTTEDTDVVITNGINELEVDTNDDGPYNAGHTTITLVHNVAIAGDWLDIFCDGTNYYVTGQTNADGGVTLA